MSIARSTTSRVLAVAAAAARAVSAADFVLGANFGHVARLATTDAGYSACLSVEDIVSTCYADVPSTASALASASCYCCDGGAPVYAGYRSCESYILASATQYTDDYTLASVAASFCMEATSAGFSCGAAAATTATTTTANRGATTTTRPASATAEATTTSTPASATGTATASSLAASASSLAATSSATVTEGSTSGSTAPDECNSFADIYSSCSDRIAGFATLRDPQVASCLCYKNGRYTTAFDGYVSTCAVWAKTALPEQYSTYLALETFCEDYTPTATATASEAGATFGGGSDSSSSTITSAASLPTATSGTRSPSTVTITPSAAATSSTSSAGAAAGAGGVMGNSFAAWLAVMLPMAAVL